MAEKLRTYRIHMDKDEAARSAEIGAYLRIIKIDRYVADPEGCEITVAFDRDIDQVRRHREPLPR